MKYIILFVLILTALAGTAFSAIDSATTTGNWSSTGTWASSSVPTKNDTVAILNGITVTVDASVTNNGDTDTTVAAIYIRQGGVLDFDTTDAGGVRLNVGAIWMGDISGTSFDGGSYSGGKLIVGPNDTLCVWGAMNSFGNEDINWRGANALVRFKGTDASNYAYVLALTTAQIYNNQADGKFDADWVYFRKLGAGVGTEGLYFGGNLHAVGQVDMDNCILDSCTGFFIYQNLANLTNCTVDGHQGWSGSTYLTLQGDNITVDGWYFDIYNNLLTGPTAISLNACDTCYILNTEIHGHNPDTTSDATGSTAINLGEGNDNTIRGCVIDSCTWGVSTSGSPLNLKMIANTFKMIGHIAWSTTNTTGYSTGWRVMLNTIYGHYKTPTGYPTTTYYINNYNDTADIDLVIAFNTIVADANYVGGGYPFHFGGAGARRAVQISGFTMVGNILVNDDADFRIRNDDIDVIFDSNGFSSNCLDSVQAEPFSITTSGRLFDGTTVPANFGTSGNSWIKGQFSSVADNYYNGGWVKVISGPDAGDSLGILDYFEANDSMVLNGAFAVTPTDSNLFYFWVDSASSYIALGNSNIDCNTPDFVDSTGWDYRLNATSPLIAPATLIDADSAWLDTAWALAGYAGAPNYNVGAYQEAGVTGVSSFFPIGKINIGGNVRIGGKP